MATERGKQTSLEYFIEQAMIEEDVFINQRIVLTGVETLLYIVQTLFTRCQAFHIIISNSKTVLIMLHYLGHADQVYM